MAEDKLGSHTIRSHSSLVDVTADQHHPRSHDHSLAADGTPIAVAGVPNLDTAKITTGRFIAARLLDGTAGYFLKAGGAGVDPAFAALAAADIASGRLVLARLPDGTSGYFLKAGGAGVDPSYALLAAADIPNLDVAKITTGRFGMPRMPDGTSGYFLKAQGAGVDPAYAAAPVTFELISSQDVSNVAYVEVTGLSGEIFSLFYDLVSDTGSTLYMRLNGVTAATYSYIQLAGVNLSSLTGQNQFSISPVTYNAANASRSVAQILIAGVIAGATPNALAISASPPLGGIMTQGRLLYGYLTGAGDNLTSLRLYPVAGTLSGIVRLYKVG